MMKLPKFEYLAPATLKEAVALLQEHKGKAKLLAGGTDLIVSMKQKLFEPEFVIGISGLSELKHLSYDEKSGLTIGAGLSWREVLESAQLNKFPALQEAAEHVATPTLQNKGTVGGNICLDTRCYYYNQSYFWRQALGWCLKKQGDYCHVAPGAGKCVAVFSSDPVTALIAYGARVRLVGPRGERTMALKDLYQDDGIHFLKKDPEEIVVDVKIPAQSPNAKSAYRKLRKRDAIDYPIANAAVNLLMEGQKIKEATVVLGAVSSCPVLSKKAAELLKGNVLDAELIEAAAQIAFKDAHPTPNTAGTPLYRKKMARVLVKRCLRSIAGLPERSV